jgi:hypothetical protein
MMTLNLGTGLGGKGPAGKRLISPLNFAKLSGALLLPLALSSCQTAAPTMVATTVATPTMAPTVAANNAPAIAPKPLLSNMNFQLWAAQGSIQCAAQWVCSQHTGPLSYVFSHDKAITKSGTGSVSIERTGPEDWGTMWQNLDYQVVAGRKIRVSADVKRTGVVGKGGGLSFVSTGGSLTEQAPIVDKFIEGSNDWRREELIISLPRSTTYARVGFALEGSGKMWVDNFMVEILPN